MLYHQFGIRPPRGTNMDAPYKLVFKIALLSAIAFLAAAPAFTQTLQVSATVVTLPQSNGATSTIVQLLGSGGEVDFTASKPAAHTWYNISPLSGRTPAALT